MIDREIAPRLRRLFDQYPIVTVTGPRQSGKTTLARETFPNLPYVNLEALDTREFAESDPRGFSVSLARVGSSMRFSVFLSCSPTYRSSSTKSAEAAATC